MARPTWSPTTLRGRLWLVPLAGAILGGLLSLLMGPQPTTLGPPTGDRVLAAEAQEFLGDPDGYGAVSVVRVRDGRSTWAGFPAEGTTIDPQTRFELGSITKTFNGLLLADAVERGEVALDDPVVTYLPELAGTPAGIVTLEELASHRSGLPSMARLPMAEVVRQDLAGAELTVYSTTTWDLINDTRTLTLTDRGTFAYSNLGAALLGHALARAAGAETWDTHVTARLLNPLQMTETRISRPDIRDPLRERDPRLAQPRLAGGRAVEEWTGEGYAPAGAGVTTTAADLTRYLEAILDGSAPGVTALDPRWDTAGLFAGQGRIGLAWISSGPPGQEIQWHNGGTGGTRTMLAVDRHTNTAAVILNSSKTDVTGAGLQLAGADGGPPRFLLTLSERDYYWVLGPLLVLIFAIGAVRGRNRLGLIARIAWALGGLLLFWLAGPWNWVPGSVFGLSVGAFVGAAAVTALRWRELPWRPRRFLWLSLPILALGGAFLFLMLATTDLALQVG
ncbi:MAG: serine hydrolase domain-containing protein [Propionibacteriaceae bacterium]|nr:serine hydrolase domain-containing protein [Propionibacteriaceae bacterium]